LNKTNAAPSRNINWVNTGFLFLTPIISIAGIMILVHYHAVHPATWILAVVMASITGIGVTAGYHRLFSHKSYEASGLVKAVLLILGAASFENSALCWASDHRRHHKYVDTDGDPYNIKRGFWYAHMGWVMFQEEMDLSDRKFDNVGDLLGDPLVMLQDRHYLFIGILAGFALPMAIGAIWGDALGGLIIAGCARIVFNHHATFSINSFCHLIGRRPYSDQNTSRDSWFVAFLTYGEGYHNYHHKFPADYRNGIRAYQWDPTKWLIRGLAFLGQASHLKRMPEDRILLARLRMDEKRLISKLERVNAAHDIGRELVVDCRVRLENAYTHFRALKAEYARLKKEKMDQWNEQWDLMNERIEWLKREIAQAQRALREAVSEWARLCGTLGVNSPRLVYHS
jgi:stearoyl-CoA desaturase (delta-9 desaturase)